MAQRYPLFLDLATRRVLVVGGGKVATRRLARLIDSSADVLLVAPTITEKLRSYVDAGQVRWLSRRYEVGDVDGAMLVLACTDDLEVNSTVALDAQMRGIWCARADDAAASAAWVPAVGNVDSVTVAVGTGGDPHRARDLRDAALVALRQGELHARPRRGGGEVVLVGGGPGDPDLITLRGYRALLEADVVITDRLGPTSLLTTLEDDVEILDVGKTPRGPAVTQDDINALLIDRAKAGKRVVRLKGGDPFIFGRGGEEVQACAAAGIAVRVVPGVSSATAAPLLAGIPLTHRGLNQHFVVASAHVPPGDPRSTVDWRGIAAGGGTLVLMMAVENRAAIAAELIAGGLAPDTPVAVIQDASTKTQAISFCDLVSLGGQEVLPPAVIVVGDVVGLANNEEAK